MGRNLFRQQTDSEQTTDPKPKPGEHQAIWKQERHHGKTKKDQRKKWEETQGQVISGDTLEPERPQVRVQSNSSGMSNTSSSS